MKKNQDIDLLIKEALTEDEQELFNSYDEQNVFQMVGGLFQGKMKWINAMSVIVQIIMLSISVYFGYRFFTTVEVVEMAQFGIGAFALFMAISIIKLSHIMEMNKNAVIREVKRMELQLALLASKLKD